MSRPELQCPPDLFYNDREAKKYNSSSRMIAIQAEISARAIELLALPEGVPGLILDVGCGTGLSGKSLEEAGHVWIGCDISRDMLAIAEERESKTGDLLWHDMGDGLPFKPATFDGVISISALQWLCYSDDKRKDPKKRLANFFTSLYRVMKRGARAALQFYPADPEQAIMVAQAATRAGFAGGLVVDYPNSAKAKKFYLCLSFEHSYTVPKALGEGGGGGGGVQAEGRQQLQTNTHRRKGKRKGVKDRDWVVKKKEQQRARGQKIKADSKFTARKRKDKF